MALALAVSPPAGALGDATSAVCSNEHLNGFTASLPDCRAYEAVTPAYKQADEGVPFAATEDGSHVLISSIGSFAGNNAGPEPRRNIGVLYDLTPSADGWLTTPISPLNPEYRGAASWDVPSADLTRMLFDMPAAPAGQESYFVREPDGTLRNVGPINPPADGPVQGPGPESNVKFEEDKFVGASADLSHILFSIRKLGWSDPTDEVASDLYEYVGAGNSEPTKVAVSDEPGHPLLSLCGADLGGPPQSSAFNAISTDGSIVFFTPLTRQVLNKSTEQGCAGTPGPAFLSLYARVDETETVPIDRSELTEAECSARHESLVECHEPKSDSTFSGAGRDGRKAYFLSTAKLAPQAVQDTVPTDGAHPQEENESSQIEARSGCEDATGSGCNLYEYNFDRPAGERLAVVSQGSATPHVQGVVRVSADGSRIYFVATGKLTAAPNAAGGEPVAGAENLYVYESDAVGDEAKAKFITDLAPIEEVGEKPFSEDSQLWGGNEGVDDERPAEATPDGKHLAFQSHADLTADDTSSGVWQSFEYDETSGALTRVSIGDEGFNNDGNTSEFNARIGAPPSYRSAGNGSGGTAPSPQFTALSSDGQYVFFETQAVLTRAAGSLPAGSYNKVYEYHAGHTYLIYGGLAGFTRLLGTDASGSDVFFQTGEQVLPEFAPAQQNLFDARVGGGTVASTDVTCSGEACLGPVTEAPTFSVPGSSSAIAGGNFGPPPPKKKTQTAAQKRKKALNTALSACRRKHVRKQRSKCESSARKRYGSASKVAARPATKRKGA